MAKKKKAKKKTTKKKAATRKTATTRKTTAKKPSRTYKAAVKPATKSQIAGALAEIHDVPRKTVTGILDSLFADIVPAEIKKHKKMNLAGMVKLVEKKKPARKARKGINPFTGEEMMFKAKPASKTVRAVALKKLKDMV